MTSLADINLQIQKHDEQIAQLRKQAEELRTRERSAVIEEVRQKVAEYGLTAADLKLSVRGASGKRGPAASANRAASRYRGPNGESWSGGRGRKPRWITEALAAGKSLADFEA